MKAYAINNQHQHLEARDKLITENIGMARRIARRMGRNADATTRDELEATALMGLVEAANRFDFKREEPFPAFAYRRIRGAILDGMRRSDILPRRVRNLANKAGGIIAQLEQELGRTPEDEEIAKRLGMPVQRYRDELAQVSKVSFVELGPEAESVAAHRSADRSSPVVEVERRQLVARVRKGLTKLGERDAQLLSLYYVEEFTYAEIGKVFGVSEARICQLHSRALVRLRTALEEDGEI